MTFDDFKAKVVPKVLTELSAQTPEPETEKKSSIRKATVEIDGLVFEGLEQNTKKGSRFARLALKGHSVAWIIRKLDNQWYLVVDGKLVTKDQVTEDGELKAAV